MSPKALHFVLEEMLAWAPAPVLARHRYGCRVLDRLRVRCDGWIPLLPIDMGDGFRTKNEEQVGSSWIYIRSKSQTIPNHFFAPFDQNYLNFLPGLRFDLQLKQSPQHLARNQAIHNWTWQQAIPHLRKWTVCVYIYMYICIYIYVYIHISLYMMYKDLERTYTISRCV